MGFLSNLGIGGGGVSPRMSEGVMGFDQVPMGGPQQPSKLQRGLMSFGNSLQQMGQPQGGGMELPQMDDPLAILRSLGIDLGSNYLGRLGQR